MRMNPTRVKRTPKINDGRNGAARSIAAIAVAAVILIVAINGIADVPVEMMTMMRQAAVKMTVV